MRLVIRTMNVNIPIIEEKVCKLVGTSGKDSCVPDQKNPKGQSILTFSNQAVGISQSMKVALQNLQSQRFLIIVRMPDVF